VKITVLLLLLSVVASLTVLVALGKIDPSYLAAVVTGIIGWLIPSPVKPPPGGGGVIGGLFMLVVLSCAGSLASRAVASKSVACDDLDSDHSLYSGLAKGFAAAAGAQGLTTIPVNDAEARAALATGTVVTATLAVIFNAISDGKADAWTRKCAPLDPVPSVSPSPSVSQ